ncbi:MAG: cytochrome c-type biogenesis protein CcmH [Nitrospinota bacterium]
MKIKIIVLAISLISVLLFVSGKFIFLTKAEDNTVLGVSHSLACPCECPMVLEDCHMSCGLEWKDLIGNQLKAGMVKADVVGYFFKRYGTESLLTPVQRLSGKWYEVTRGGFPLKDMIYFVLIIFVWTALVYSVLMMLLEKTTFFKKTA